MSVIFSVRVSVSVTREPRLSKPSELTCRYQAHDGMQTAGNHSINHYWRQNTGKLKIDSNAPSDTKKKMRVMVRQIIL